MKARDRSYPVALGSGLNTSRIEQTSESAVLRVFKNVRSDQGGVVRRPGMVRIGRITPPSQCGDFDGTNDILQFNGDTRIWPLGTRWTVEALCRPDALTGTHTILGGDAANAGLRIQMDTTGGGRVLVTVRDSAGTDVTLTVSGITTAVVYAIQVVRDGASLTLRVNGTEDTDTMHATNVLGAQVSTAITGVTIGATAGASFFDGAIDFVRGFSTAKTHQRDGWRRLLDPYADDVLFDICTGTTSSRARDRSRYGNHASSSNLPTNTTALCVNPSPIQSIAQRTKANGARELVVVAGGGVYPVAVT